MKLPVPEYGAVPPVALTVTVVVSPLQAKAYVAADEEATNTVGSLTDPDVIEVHPFASVTV